MGTLPLARGLRGPVAAALLSLACLSTSAQADPILSFSPLSSTVLTDDSFSLDVAIEGAVDLFAFQFDVTFDPLLLRVDDVLEGAFLSGGGPTFFIPGPIDNTAGSITFTANTLLSAVPGVSGNGILATLLFTALDAGDSEILLGNPLLLDSNLADITPISTSSGSVEVLAPSAAVPEPATLLLLGTGVAGCIARSVAQRRKIRRTRG